MVFQMPDIVVTLDCEEYEINFDDWEETTDWEPWVLKTRLPEIHKKNKIYICYCGEIIGYKTIKKIEYNMDLPKDSTEIKIYGYRFFRINPPILTKCLRGWWYF